MEQQRLQVAEGTIMAYEEHGEGLPLLAIHGYYPDRRLMTGCLEGLFDGAGRTALPPGASYGRPSGGLSSGSFRRIYPDLPFMGASSDPEWVVDSDRMLDVVAAFAEKLIPEGPFLLMGESYGGYLARGLVRLFGDRIAGLCLLCPMIVAQGSERDVPPLVAMYEEADYRGGRDPGDIEAFESVAVVRDRYCLDRSLVEVIPGVRAARAEALEALRERGYAFSFDGLGGGAEGKPFDVEFDGPTLFLLARQDASVGWRDAFRLADSYPRGTYAVIDGAGHNLQIEQAGLFSCHVGAWLAACELELRSPSGT